MTSSSPWTTPPSTSSPASPSSNWTQSPTPPMTMKPPTASTRPGQNAFVPSTRPKTRPPKRLTHSPSFRFISGLEKTASAQMPAPLSCTPRAAHRRSAHRFSAAKTVLHIGLREPETFGVAWRFHARTEASGSTDPKLSLTSRRCTFPTGEIGSEGAKITERGFL